MIRVLLVDDHTSFRQPLAFMMEREPDLTVVGQAGSLAEGRRLLPEVVDVAVVDLHLPDGSGLDLVRDLYNANRYGMVMVLTALTDRRIYARALEAGASAVLHKSSGIKAIIDAVRRLGQGEPLMSPREVIDLLGLSGERREQSREAQAAFARLTQREREVLQALGDGCNDNEIAERLSVTAEAARTHIVNILGKLGVASRLQALALAVRLEVITIA